MNKLLGERIKEIRKARKITQAKLAELINVDSKYISRIETSNGSPSLEVLENIASALQIETKELFETSHLKTKEDLDFEITKNLKKLDIKETRIVYGLVNSLSSM
ncbi:MAG: helix-turn-helix transcriptional regulator [bacterium]|nr:helix-turn-helix transcriptional regulator [bacterium]